MRSPKLVLASLVVLLIVITIPAAALALEVSIDIDGVPCNDLNPVQDPENENTLLLKNSSNGLPVTCEVFQPESETLSGTITIDSAAPDSFPQISALPGDSANQLILSNVVITNNGPDPHTITIRYNHLFTGVNERIARFYGMSASGSFFRPPFDLASGDSFTFTSNVDYPAPSPELLFAGPNSVSVLIGTLPYEVPSSGSVSLNDFSPQNPAQVIKQISCLSQEGADCGDVETLGSETIKAEASFVLAPDDSIILVGSFHTAGCTDQGTCARILSGLAVRIDPKPGQSPNFFGPRDKGAFIVDLLGSPEFCSTVDGTETCIPAFDVKQVDLGSVVFGPACGSPSATLSCGAKPRHASFIDANHDGIRDVRLQFNNPEIGWNPNCDPSQKTATLKGLLKGQDQTDFPGFSASASVVCLPPKKK